MENYDKISNSIDDYLDKKDLEIHQKYLICKNLADEYLEEWSSTENEEDDLIDENEDDTDDGDKGSSDASPGEKVSENN